MKLPNPYACDICKRQKQDSNRWFKAYLMSHGILITDWDESQLDEEPLAQADLCGESCVHEWISRNLSKIN